MTQNIINIIYGLAIFGIVIVILIKVPLKK